MHKKLLAASVFWLAGSTLAAAQEQTLTISVYGFAQDEFSEALYKPFEAECGCKLVVETGNSIERLAKLDANKEAPVIDMAVFSLADALAASRKGLTEKLDTAKLSNYDKLYDFAKDPNGDGMSVGYTFYKTGIAYRTDKMKVESWADLLKDEYVGHVALPNITTNQGGPVLSMIGKALGKDSPDLKEAMAAVGEKRDEFVTFYVKSSQLVQLMQQEEIWAAPMGHFSWAGISKLDLPVGWATTKEGDAGDMNAMVLVKGSKNQDLALKFMDFWLSVPIQTKIAEMLIDSPANKDVVLAAEIDGKLTYGADVAYMLTFLPAATTLVFREKWLAEWNTTIAQ
ncbi:MAG: polyamine ABC transporter substrate-binding protein [Shinella sp.]|uniref:polyamine ABC transporter substrate-binding protein n=1 Tax=Shinella sp. TaxID=1870904 RepID=UPI0040355649